MLRSNQSPSARGRLARRRTPASLRSRIVAMLAIAASASGCAIIPLPHSARLAPGVEGVVLTEGAPVAGVEVVICEATSETCCTGKARASVTDDQGRFVLEPPREIRVFAYIMAHRQFYWCLGAGRGDAAQYAGPFRDYSLHGSGPVWDYSFTCELSEMSFSCTHPKKLRRSGDYVIKRPSTRLNSRR